MTSSATSEPMRIIEKNKRRSSYIFETDHPSLPQVNKTDPNDDDDAEDNPTILPFKLGYLTPEMVEEANLQLNETDEVKQRCLKELRQFVESEENLVCRTDDNFLLQFLRSRKYNVQKALKLLQNFFHFRKDYNHIYSPFNNEIVKQLILHNIVGYLTMRDRKGSVVFLLKIGSWNPDVDSFEEMFRAISTLLVHAIEDPATQVTGFRAIIDFRGISWKQIKFSTPRTAYLIIRSTQFCFPGRYKGVHLFSDSRFFSLLWTIYFPFLTNKLKGRIFHHGNDVNALHQYIHPSVLPAEYGGMQGPFDNSSWVDSMNKEESAMLNLLKYGYK